MNQKIKTNMPTIVLFLLTLAAVKASAQKQFIGIIGGVEQSNSYLTHVQLNSKSRIAFCGGVTYEYMIGKFFTVGAGASFSQQGFSLTTPSPGGGTASEIIRDNYLTIPLKAGFHIGKRVYGFVNIGLSPEYELTSERILYFPHSSPIVRTDMTGLRRLDFFALAELGAGYKFNEKLIILVSLTSQCTIPRFNKNYNENGPNAYNYGLTLSAGVKYSLP